MKSLKRISFACVPVLLVACATPTPPGTVKAETPSQWYAPLPHSGDLTALSQWWQQQGDPLLAQLVESAQTVSSSVASAKSRIEQARATRVAAGAALLPTLDVAVSASRASSQPPLPMGTTSQAALQSAWEIDLFGANRAGRDAAQARFDGVRAAWHDARVSVAAEVANQYFSLRACEKLLDIATSDAGSRAETSRLSDMSAKAGFQAPATAALARASAAEGNVRATQQRALCDIDIKALVALTAIPEPELRQKIAAATAVQAAPIAIASVPAQTLTQRPDVFAAEREVAAASAEVGSAQAQRFPRLSLSGSIGAANFRTGGTSTDLSTWSIGPLALNLPLFDGGRRAAAVDAAQARYEEAVANYRARVRQAVREVEEALVLLQSTGARSADALTATEGYRTSFKATSDRYQNGLASLVELEESRRTRLASENALVLLERERRAAWIALYRAAGGGWRDAEPLSTASQQR